MYVTIFLIILFMGYDPANVAPRLPPQGRKVERKDDMPFLANRRAESAGAV